ncbi:MAG: leucine-rich repeat domain-containing protein [Clostridia bacterium]|nr:leucine-rich repeat domain-containing protein [Clostridia bacterium]
MSDRKKNTHGGSGASEKEPQMTLIPLPDGTYRMCDLKIGDPNKRYWQYNERGHIEWQADGTVVTVPDLVSTVGRLRCPMLGEVILPPSVREIDELAFGAEFYSGDTYEWYALHTVHFSQGIERIGYRAFYNCKNLNGVHLPKGLREIGEGAFGICLSLSRITIPESVERVGYRAFALCKSLSEVIFRDGLEAIGGEVFADDKRLSHVVLPKTLLRIGPRCFAGCESLAEIELPESLCELWDGAFSGCVSLGSLTFGRDLLCDERIHKESPFLGCTALSKICLEDAVRRADWIPAAPALTEFKVSRGHPEFSVVDGALYSKDKKTLLRVPGGISGEYSVPRGVTAIADNAFRGCGGISEVRLPSTLLTIGKRAFAECTSLCSIDIPGKLTDIGEGAFLDCKALTRVHISGSVCHIGEGALLGCDALAELTVSLENKHYRADGCKLLRKA